MKRGSLILLVAASTAVAASHGQSGEWQTRLPAPVVDTDFYESANSSAKFELGRLLFFDKALSGNQNIACATCHHPDHGTSDGLALPLGEGPRGLGPDRHVGEELESSIHERVPRNSPALFNLGAREFTRMFHDGRVETDPEGNYEGGFITPAKWKLPKGLDNVLAAQAMFPVTSPAEMAGQKGENPVANARALNNAAGKGGVWEQVASRLQQFPEYVELFAQAFPDQVESPEDISFVLAANAIGEFEAQAFRADDSPFDRYLRGDHSSLSDDARRGMELFYGEAGCSSCHSGKFQTDHDFHAIAMPQIGPGKADGWDQGYWRDTGIRAFVEDHGRGRVTVREEDRYKFRTPSLRNVAITGPWGHAGNYATLRQVIEHHLDPVNSLASYELDPELLPPVGRVVELGATGSTMRHEWLNEVRQAKFERRDGWVQDTDELRSAIAKANELEPRRLDDESIACLEAFLEALTDARSLDLSHLVPDRVPSGLPVAD